MKKFLNYNKYMILPMAQAEGNSGMKNKCGVCGQEFGTIELLDVHNRNDHGIPPNSPSEAKQ